MKRKLLFLIVIAALIAVLAGAAVASEKIGLKVNGREVLPDVAPQIVDGRVLVPVRWIAEALGTEVEWDKDTSTVKVSSFRNDRRVELLESALAPASPDAAADIWAKGVKTRNAALQYAVMSSELRDTSRADFESMNWVTGTSSPWVDHYNLSKSIKNPDGTFDFEVSFVYTDSTGSLNTSTEKITVGEDGSTGQWAEKKWSVSKISP